MQTDPGCKSCVESNVEGEHTEILRLDLEHLEKYPYKKLLITKLDLGGINPPP